MKIDSGAVIPIFWQPEVLSIPRGIPRNIGPTGAPSWTEFQVDSISNERIVWNIHSLPVSGVVVVVGARLGWIGPQRWTWSGGWYRWFACAPRPAWAMERCTIADTEPATTSTACVRPLPYSASILGAAVGLRPKDAKSD